MDNMIEINGLTKRFGSNIIFENYSATIPDGVTCLTGPSGSGKTTLARILAGLENAEAGTVSGVDNNVVFLFQDPRLLGWKTALGNVTLAADPHRFPSAQAAELADSFLAALALEPDDRNKYPAELSGGMRQRVALARAAVLARSIISSGSRVSLTVLDEPLKGLDQATRDLSIQFIRDNLLNNGGSIIIITHDQADLSDFRGNILHI